MLYGEDPAGVGCSSRRDRNTATFCGFVRSIISLTSPSCLMISSWVPILVDIVIVVMHSFTWYLCLLPLCTGNMNLQANNNTNDGIYDNLRRRRLVRALSVLGLSIVLWLGSAYCLEMRGMAVHRFVWIASVIYFFANVHLLGTILQSIQQPQDEQQQSPLLSSHTDTMRRGMEKKTI